MVLSGPATTRPTRRERLGLPRARGAGPLLAAALVDSLGSGLFLPYALLYFLGTTGLPAPTVGLALSAAAALALPCSALFGPLVDRAGARRSVVLANLAQAAGFVGYMGAASAGQIVAFGFLVTAGQNLFWTANGVLVTTVSAPEDRVRWFSLLRVVRNVGTGVGALLASLIAAGAAGGPHPAGAVSAVGAVGAVGAAPIGGRAVVVANAGSFLLAAAVLARWRPQPPPAAVSAGRPPREPPPAALPEPVRPPRRPGYRQVLADRRFAALNAATVLFVLCLLGPPLILALYVTRTLDQPAWVAGAFIAGNTALVVAFQTPVTEALRPHRGTRLLHLAAVLFAASFALLWAAHAADRPPWLAFFLVAALFGYTAGEIVSSPVLTDLVATLAPADLRGRYFAVSQLCWSLAAVLAPGVLTRLTNAGTLALWGTLLVVSCGAFALVPAVARPPGASPEPPAPIPLPAEPPP
ncbi:MFS transporter [Actinacidiphila sp. ITFR-21]|uniref:MFS transporter n=1 Tax=Actinacidiphila sp. ITFR-21 TaxID=3075199 RepID=UPI00288A66C3|nr:MFS transporter [Streptomyces sp. ITFR-21]WNI16401.1 MFS transporter [Streptomyces sp. ITFR-21]